MSLVNFQSKNQSDFFSIATSIPPFQSSIAVEWCREVGSKANTVEEALVDPEVKRAIQEGVSRVNSGAISNAQRVQKWCIIPTDFSLPGGELGPTLKLKRHFVLEKYQKKIDNFYGVETVDVAPEMEKHIPRSTLATAARLAQ